MKLITLKKNRDFGFVYRRGRSCSTKLMVLIYVPKKEKGVRAGFSVSKKVGKSVMRNRKRRQLKESFRLLMQDIGKNTDIIFIARAPIAEAEFSDIKRDMNYLLKKSGLISSEDKK